MKWYQMRWAQKYWGKEARERYRRYLQSDAWKTLIEKWKHSSAPGSEGTGKEIIEAEMQYLTSIQSWRSPSAPPIENQLNHFDKQL